MLPTNLINFIDSLSIESNDGKEGIERTAFKVFYVSNHGITADNIYDRILDRNNSRTLATPRLLGIVENVVDEVPVLSEIGEIFMSPCSDRSKIFQDQYKKWHFPNSVANRGEANTFNAYPYWIILEFLVMCAKEDIFSLTTDEFMIFVATIRSRDKIEEHINVFKYLRKNPQYWEEFKNSIPDNENLFARFYKSSYHELLGSCLEFIQFNEEREEISLSSTDYEFLINRVNYFYGAYDLHDNYSRDSSYYKEFLSKQFIDNTFNIFTMPNSFNTGAYHEVSTKINNDYPFYNVLLKGVPGTGKSHFIEQVLNVEIFGLKETETEHACLSTSVLKNKNVIRLNIHLGLSNSELMQGIGVHTTAANEIKYYEKRGIVLKHIAKAILNPSLPYVIILEEIQENNLNKLIGDLIFLIEESRRVEFTDDHYDLLDHEIDFGMVSELVVSTAEHNKVALPSLIEDSQELFICLPKNLYFFCTTNYRDDKKIMEDNLLRRFEIIDLYPDSSVLVSDNVRKFFEALNESIFNHFDENFETHPDRYLIGHAIWINVNDVKTFVQAMNKVIVDMKDLKDLDWDIFVKIISNTRLNISEYNSYKDLLQDIQNHIYKGIEIQGKEFESSVLELI
ncbi:hypothetical protein VSO92_12670 [Myroides pelagicus]|uniref:hypothetical protein n=1 Tax=Myroides pelagicus TaxID=270914 RepID=UPI002DB69208|nr:hypothetical protein [Myroides pelagicus]MEC4114956.1 hypothetical protein [Myroides pelagicus]